MSSATWRQAPDHRAEARELAAELGLDPVIAHLLINRGIARESMAEFLKPTAASLHDPAGLPDMPAAAQRLAKAITNRERVVVYGDYDVDGCCAGAILTRFLASHGLEPIFYVPSREVEGYGLHSAALINLATKQHAQLIVTVDCGVNSGADIDMLKTVGCKADFVVTDHHLPSGDLPSVPTVNAHREDSDYPFKDLCGAGVAYKLCMQTATELGEDPHGPARDLLQLAALATIADMVPLVGENRFLVYYGLKALAKRPMTGLAALLDVCGKSDKSALTASDVAFGLSPRLNAAGRVDSARAAYDLLCCDDQTEAYELAEQLQRYNDERKELEDKTCEQAMNTVRQISLDDHWGLVVAGEGWSRGVVGLVAGRLCRRFHRPVLALSIQGDEANGSGRSIPGVNLVKALDDCNSVLTSHGGHERAAGLGLPADKVGPLAELFEKAVRAQMSEDDLVGIVEYECALKPASVTLDLAHKLQALGPYGEGNPQPAFRIGGLTVERAQPTRDGKHATLRFSAPGGERGTAYLGAFWSRAGQTVEKAALRQGERVEVVAEIEVNSYQGVESPQLMIRDLRRSAAERR